MKAKFLFVVCTAVVVLMFLFSASGTAFSQEPYMLQSPPYVQTQFVCRGGHCAPIYAYPPQQIYVPRVEYQPYELQSTEVRRAEYRTPIRTWLFGRYRVQHHYAPVQQEQK